jgi:large subunit ribosomal protein L29
MKANEVREMESDEMHTRIGELKEELFNLRFQLATGQLDNHSRISAVKRDVARIRTILRERDFMASEQAKTTTAPAEEGQEEE